MKNSLPFIVAGGVAISAGILFIKLADFVFTPMLLESSISQSAPQVAEMLQQVIPIGGVLMALGLASFVYSAFFKPAFASFDDYGFKSIEKYSTEEVFVDETVSGPTEFDGLGAVSGFLAFGPIGAMLFSSSKKTYKTGKKLYSKTVFTIWSGGKLETVHSYSREDANRIQAELNKLVAPALVMGI